MNLAQRSIDERLAQALVRVIDLSSRGSAPRVQEATSGRPTAEAAVRIKGRVSSATFRIEGKIFQTMYSHGIFSIISVYYPIYKKIANGDMQSCYKNLDNYIQN